MQIDQGGHMIGIYFSGTGNTKFCLSQFLSRIDNNIPMYSIEDNDVVAALCKSEDIVFAYPIYYSNVPKIVHDFIEENSSVWAGKNIYIIATMGLFSGDGTGVSARIFKKYDANVIGGLHLRMPDCIGDVKALKKSFEENRNIIEKTCNKIENAARHFLDNSPTQEGLSVFSHLAGLIGQRLYFRNKTKEYTQNPKIDTKKCIGCKMCEAVCPMHNMHIKNDKAVSGNMCTMCYRCFSSCPRQAITLIGKSVLVQHKMEDYLNNSK